MSEQQPSSPPAPEAEVRTLTRDMIATPQGVFTLGLICARLLQQHEEAHLHVSLEGVVEVIPKGETELDMLPEEVALQQLVKIGYTDSQLESYLKGREARAKRRP